MTAKSLVPPSKLLQSSTEEAHGAEALAGSLASLPTGLHSTGRFLLPATCHYLYHGGFLKRNFPSEDLLDLCYLSTFYSV